MTSELAISPQTMTLRNNFILNFNFHGQTCGSIAIDFDDETSQMNVTQNVLVYALHPQLAQAAAPPDLPCVDLLFKQTGGAPQTFGRAKSVPVREGVTARTYEH